MIGVICNICCQTFHRPFKSTYRYIYTYIIIIIEQQLSSSSHLFDDDYKVCAKKRQKDKKKRRRRRRRREKRRTLEIDVIQLGDKSMNPLN